MIRPESTASLWDFGWLPKDEADNIDYIDQPRTIRDRESRTITMRTKLNLSHHREANVHSCHLLLQDLFLALVP